MAGIRTQPPSRVKILVNKAVVRVNVYVYRKTGGRFLGEFGGLQALLLTTLGARSGRSRTNPVTFIRDGERLIIVAVYGGEAVNPGWYWNLRATPRAFVQIGRDRFQVTAEFLPDGPERDRLWAHLLKIFPLYTKFQRRTDRLIPIVALTPVGRSPSHLRKG
jgi:deazaflavin-dependent oxidoreductase (nitroreductase family)